MHLPLSLSVIVALAGSALAVYPDPACVGKQEYAACTPAQGPCHRTGRANLPGWCDSAPFVCQE